MANNDEEGKFPTQDALGNPIEEETEETLTYGDPGDISQEGYFEELEKSGAVEESQALLQRAADARALAAGERAAYYASPEFGKDIDIESIRGISRAAEKADVRDPFALEQVTKGARGEAAKLKLAGKETGLKAKEEEKKALMESKKIGVDIAETQREDLARQSELKEATMDKFHGQIDKIIADNTTWVWADDENIAAAIRKAAEALPFDDEKEKWLNIARRIEEDELDIDSDMTWESIETDTAAGKAFGWLPDPLDWI